MREKNHECASDNNGIYCFCLDQIIGLLLLGLCLKRGRWKGATKAILALYDFLNTTTITKVNLK